MRDKLDHIKNEFASRKRKKKMEKVMREYGMGTLRSSSGQRVMKRKQALAIAMSEARRA